MSLFRRSQDREEAQRAIDNARNVVGILTLSRANLQAADSLLKKAAGHLSRGYFAEAMVLAEKAERIAIAVESEYRAATEARERLQNDVLRMDELEMTHEGERKSLDEMRARAKSKRMMEGVEVPDYEGALTVANEAASRAEATIALREKAGDVLFSAELALAGAEDLGEASSEVTGEAQGLLAKARAEAEQGQYEVAATDAAVAEKIALGLLSQHREAVAMIDSVEKLVVGLRAAGASVDNLRRSLDTGKALLEKGKMNAAMEVLHEASEESRSLGILYRELLNVVSGAAEAIEALEAEGLSSTEADLALDRAESAMKQGNYALASACCQDVHVAVGKARAFRDGLRSSLEEAKAKLMTLRDSGVPFVNDAEEMVRKAENEFANGEYEASNEDLRIASLLLAPALNDRAKAGPTLP